MKTCINCGQVNPDGAKFCINCGVVLPAAKQKPAPVEEPPLTGEPTEEPTAEAAEDHIGAETTETAQQTGYSYIIPPADDASAAAPSPSDIPPTSETAETAAHEAAPDPAEDFNAYYQAQGGYSPQPDTPGLPPAGTSLPEELRPLSTLEYFCYLFLFSIPLIGFVCMIIFAAGASRNQNLRNLSRAYLLLAVLAFLAAVLFFGCGMLLSQAVFW